MIPLKMRFKIMYFAFKKGLKYKELRGVWIALEQMLAKGKLTKEEKRRIKN